MDARTNVEISAANTTADQIWQAAYARILTVGGFKTYRRTPLLTLQPDDLPALSVYLLRDREQPLGEPQTLEPRFIEYAHLGLAGAIKASDIDAQLEMLANKLMAAKLVLYTDPSFITLIRGIESSDTKLVFSRLGETPVAEYQMELVVSFETLWPPEVTDDFLVLHLETAFPTYEQAAAGTPQIIRSWDIDQNAPPPAHEPGVLDQLVQWMRRPLE